MFLPHEAERALVALVSALCARAGDRNTARVEPCCRRPRHGAGARPDPRRPKDYIVLSRRAGPRERTHGLAGDRGLPGDRPPPDRLVRAAPGLPQLPDGPGNGGRVSRRALPRAAERATGEMAADPPRPRQGMTSVKI